jgi:hypothetical protein
MPGDKGADQGSAARTTKNSIEATLARMEAAMLAMSKTIEDNAKNLKDSMADVTKSITENEERLNMAMDEKIAGLRDELKRDLTTNINQNVADIKSNKNSIDDLKATVTKLENMIELNNKCNDLIVKGVPVLISENPLTIYQKMATTLGYGTDSVPQVEVFRLGKKKAGAKHDPPLLIKFQNPYERQRFYDKYFEFGNLKLQHVGIEADQRIYISENLTKMNQPIFAAAMRLKRERKIASVSTSNGTVHVKPRQGDRRVPIRDMSELERY